MQPGSKSGNMRFTWGSVSLNHVVTQGTKNRITGWQVARKIDEAATTGGICLIEIGMLDDAHERKVRVIDVHPIEFRQASRELEHHADVSEIADRADAFGIVRRPHAA